MKNKGFTLIELLAVILILLIIFILVFPSVQSIIFKSNDTITNKQIDTILNASYDFSLQNIKILPDSNRKNYLTLAQLKSNGLIEIDLTNPETKELYPNDLVISIENVGSGYKYSNPNSKLRGDYLYTVELTNVANYDKKPEIILEGLTKNLDGHYISEIDINSTFVNAKYKATSSTGLDLTSRVFVSITYNNISVENIDTSKLGIYKVYYVVVDDNGYSTSVIRSVIITDKELPVLTLPENITISTSVTSLNLLEGVECKDNSGVCNITYNGNIIFGTSGKYIIEYIAQDSSGNTISSKRIITIE